MAGTEMAVLASLRQRGLSELVLSQLLPSTQQKPLPQSSALARQMSSKEVNVVWRLAGEKLLEA